MRLEPELVRCHAAIEEPVSLTFSNMFNQGLQSVRQTQGSLHTLTFSACFCQNLEGVVLLKSLQHPDFLCLPQPNLGRGRDAEQPADIIRQRKFSQGLEGDTLQNITLKLRFGVD